jgi:hypothetical protein
MQVMRKPGAVFCHRLQERPSKIRDNCDELRSTEPWHTDSTGESPLQSLLEATESTQWSFRRLLKNHCFSTR